ncbi:mannose-6-phosphate isomerase, class I [Alkalicoccobacillus porphyridii]|uniref:Mannose-6-phosphate isomerase n=1 Tax=Alkalicoccobacillus porphyridii TaxID=2597270 RepID=A0A553ZWI1_9BACI|nr:mannose-6-phosphate isomerase, class I [Alkalicoccobacillus porphyridii]TSB45829.1 mannose-6-phosphate isomerase, class I [Alkalicoccobacillus porphyridii]
MYKQPIFFKPVFKERIWGGTKLREEFGYDIPSEKTGECWGISAHPNGPSLIQNGPLEGTSLDTAWENHREIFGDAHEEQFPLLIKILDANADLSVQVHPDDAYANEHENGELGKTECWYVIDCEPGAELILGHNAESKEELASAIKEGHWDTLLRRVPVKKGDFFYVPSGTIHALGKGTLILETQQSSDTTYRVYDFDRVDDSGNTRELHVAPSINVTTVPHQDATTSPKQEEQEGLKSTRLVSEQYFTVYEWELCGTVERQAPSTYLLASVLEGNGNIVVDGIAHSFEKGSHFIIPATIGAYSISGGAKLIISHTT